MPAVLCLGLSGLIALFYLKRELNLDFSLAEINPGMDEGLLFLIGLLTSFHCIGMCGGFVVSYALADVKHGRAPWRGHLSYALGKLLSYSGFGALFGALGGLVTFTLQMRAGVSLVAGGFLILYGLSFFPAFNLLKRLHLRLPRSFSQAVGQVRQKTANAFIVGLLNGLMIACGPLQAVYIMAAETADPWQGARFLAVFALGTLPVMLTFGGISSVIGVNALKHMTRISGLVIVIMGLVMFDRGLTLAGKHYDPVDLTRWIGHWISDMPKQKSALSAAVQTDYQLAYMEVYAGEYRPDTFHIVKNLPVKWIIDVKELVGCNQILNVPWLRLEYPLKHGLQKIEFLPSGDQTVLSFSCAMGMIKGRFQLE